MILGARACASELPGKTLWRPAGAWAWGARNRDFPIREVTEGPRQKNSAC